MRKVTSMAMMVMMMVVMVAMVTRQIMEGLVHSPVLATLVVTTLQRLSSAEENRVHEEPVLR